MKKHELGEVGNYGIEIIEDLGMRIHGLKRRHIGLFRCSCGKEFISRLEHIKSGHTMSCGCAKSHPIHGLYDDPLYGRWADMRRRCNNVNNSSYSNYGGRGIRMCKEWDDFAVFYNYVTSLPDYDIKLTLDRIDNDGNYESGNLRWATRLQQVINRRPSKKAINNTSGYTGVSLSHHTWNGCGYDAAWSSVVKVDGCKIWLGVFDSPRKAALRRDAEIITKGLNLRLNFE